MGRAGGSSHRGPHGVAGATSGATSGVAATLRGLGVRPSRRLGQSFLTDARVAARIASLLEDPSEPALEIGPGLGALTQALAATGRRLVAVEIDFRLAEHLEDVVAVHARASVVRGDILDQEISALLPKATTCTVIGNLPYAVTTPILEWLIAQSGSFRRAYLMVQREVAARITARPGGKERGSMTVFLALHAQTRSLFRVPAGAFHPRPDVDSAVIELVPRPYPGTSDAERGAVERVARAGMGTRRKTLVNALGLGLGITPGTARSILEDAAIAPTRRGETLEMEEWVALARAWRSVGGRG